MLCCRSVWANIKHSIPTSGSFQHFSFSLFVQGVTVESDMVSHMYKGGGNKGNGLSFQLQKTCRRSEWLNYQNRWRLWKQTEQIGVCFAFKIDIKRLTVSKIWYYILKFRSNCFFVVQKTPETPLLHVLDFQNLYFAFPPNEVGQWAITPTPEKYKNAWLNTTPLMLILK